MTFIITVKLEVSDKGIAGTFTITTDNCVTKKLSEITDILKIL